MASSLQHILHLLWAPRRLPETAIELPLWPAALASLIAIDLMFTLLAMGAFASVYEPYRDFAHYALTAIQGAPRAAAVGAVPAMGVGLWIGLLALTARDHRARAALKVFALSFLPFLLPVLFYSICLFIAAAGSPGFGFHPGSKPGWVEWPIFRVLGSCFWLPVMFFVWFGFWFWATEKAGRWLRHAWPPVCEGCGYDLRGSVAAGGTDCPECGMAIPPEPLSPGP